MNRGRYRGITFEIEVDTLQKSTISDVPQEYAIIKIPLGQLTGYESDMFEQYIAGDITRRTPTQEEEDVMYEKYKQELDALHNV